MPNSTFVEGALAALPAPLTTIHGAAAAVVLLALTALWLASASDDWARLPGPQPSSWLLGHLSQVNVPNVHRFFQENTQKFGPLFKFRLAHMRVVVVSDPVLVQAVISRASDLPKAHEVYDAVDELFSPRGHRSFFNTHSAEEWRLVRKATAPAFSLDNIRRAFPRLLQVTNELCDVLAARVRGGQPEVDVTEAAMRVTLDVIGSTGYGYDFEARKYGQCELFDIVPPLLAEFTLRGTNPLRRTVHALMPWLPAARAYNRRVKACHKWWRVLLGSVRALDLGAAAAAGDTSLRACLARLPFSDDLLTPQVAVYLIAGFETTAHSIAWALLEIALNPGVQAKVEEELAAAGLLGPSRRQLEFSDLAELPYLNCVLRESMRLHPVASTGTIRKADRPIELGGYRLSPGTLVWLPFVSLHTSRHNWERAEEFWPERWQVAEAAGGSSSSAAAGSRAAAGEGSKAASAGGPTPLGHAAAPAKTFLPFSDGPRDCIGQNLALMEARAVLATVCGRFRLSVVPRMGDREAIRSQEVMKLTLQCKDGIHLRLEERS